jgi:hypothetical protein
MPSLRDVQGLFWGSITAGPERLALLPRLCEVVEPSATLDAAERIQVYADAYFWRLRDVLAEDFPHLATLLGPDRLEELARDYVCRHPSTHPSLRNLGRGLPAYLAHRTDLPPYLADLARLEWARIDVFDAPEREPVTIDALRAVRPDDWPALRFMSIPALKVLHVAWPVHQIWAGADPVTLTPSPTFIRVWRAPDYSVFHSGMDARSAHALGRLIAGQPFAAVCDTFTELVPLEAAQQATALLARWLEDGIIAGVA